MFSKNRTMPHRKGAALVEYVVLMGLLAVVVIFVIVKLGADITATFDDSNTTVVTEIETATGITLPGSGGPGSGGNSGGGIGTPIEPQAGETVLAAVYGTVYRNPSGSSSGSYFNIADQLADWAIYNSPYSIDATYLSGMSWTYTFVSGDIGTLSAPEFNSDGTYGAFGWDNGESCATVPYPNTETVIHRAEATGPNGENWQVDVSIDMTDFIC